MRILALTLSLLIAASANASASTIAYWTFDDGQVGTTAGTLLTESNSPTLNAAAGKNGSGAIPMFHAAVPNVAIRDGVGGPIVNALNASSLEFVRTGTADSNDGGRLTVVDPGGIDSLLKPASFTIEAFIQIDSATNWPALMSKSRADGNGSSWMLDMNNNGTLRARFDTQALGASSGTGFNQNFTTSLNLADQTWHHVAMTYDADTRMARLFVDYEDRGGGTVINPLVYDNNPMLIGQGGGGRAFDGWMDEIRLSDSVLTTDQFLRAEVVPEPGTLALVGMMLLGLAFVVRRRK